MFTRATNESASLSDDLTGLALWADAEGKAQLLSGVAGYESGSAAGPAVLGWFAQGTSWMGSALLTAAGSSTGPVATGDVDGDGDLDVFVGGRLRAGRWPEPCTSRFFRNDAGELVEEEWPPFANLGLVSDALLADLDGDGFPELIVALELGPLRIFQRDQDTWKEMTEAWGLAGLIGWWNSVATGDFDGDGRLDLVVGNRGQNTSWQIRNRGHARVVWAELDAELPILVVEAAESGPHLLPLRDRHLLAAVLPDLPDRIPTHAAYAEAGVAQILGPVAPQAKDWQTDLLTSVVLLNRGGRFEVRPLPREAQWAPVWGLAVADFDADGHLDLALAQNLFAVHPEEPRLDTGQGLILRGNGTGEFTVLDSRESGVAVYGEQRGAAAADFDEDGRMDLVLTQNGAQTVLFHNTGTPPGLRVRLVGPPGNPDGVGAVVVPVRDGTRGAAQTLTGGGGYWSQAGAVLVVGGPRPTELEVRWPGGRTVRVAVPDGGRQIEVNWPDPGQ